MWQNKYEPPKEVGCATVDNDVLYFCSFSAKLGLELVNGFIMW